MSSWIVTKKHIDLLVGALRDEGIIANDSADLDKVGRMLWHENYCSVNYRYNESELVPGYRFEEPEKLAVLVVRKQIECYCYQACDHNEWAESKAHSLMQHLKAALLAKEPRVIMDPTYESAPWGID